MRTPTKAAYQFRFSEEHLLAAVQKYRKQMWWRAPFCVLKGVLAAPLLGLVILSFWTGHQVTGTTLGTLFGVLLFSRKIDAWALRRRFRQSPYHNDDVSIVLSSHGLNGKGNKSETAIEWNGFTKARRFEDGLLLLQGPNAFNWLADSDADNPESVLAAQELASRYVTDYKQV